MTLRYQQLKVTGVRDRLQKPVFQFARLWLEQENCFLSPQLAILYKLHNLNLKIYVWYVCIPTV